MGKPKKQAALELDLNSYELRRGGRVIPLERQPMELLILLADRHGQLVTRDEIELRLWGPGGSVGAEPIINNCIYKLRLLLGDDKEDPHLIQTVFRRGYRLVGAIQVIPRAKPLSQGTGDVAEPPDSRDGYNQNSMAVLPFKVLGEKQHHALSIGYMDALISALGNLEGFFVLPTAAVMRFSGDIDPTIASSRLGVRYLLQGSIQVQNQQQRISVQLFDAFHRRVAFAQKVDHSMDNMLQAQDEIARNVADSLHRKIRGTSAHSRERYSKDKVAYAEFMEGYRHTSTDDPRLYDIAILHLSNAIDRDPQFALAHAILSFVYANRFFEFDPTRRYLEKAEYHSDCALKLDPDLGEAHLAAAFLLWSPSQNFQHLNAIRELKKALELQPNLRHAHNRLGSILAHIGLLWMARQMYEHGRNFEPGKALSHGVTQAYLWNGDYELAEREIRAWRAENPASKYPVWFAPQPALLRGDLDQAQREMEQAMRTLGSDPLISSLQGVLWARLGENERALRCVQTACESPGSFGHSHHIYYQLACTYSTLGQTRIALEWLDRSVHTGFACWPLFLRDPSLANVRELPEFDSLVDLLRTKYTEALLG